MNRLVIAFLCCLLVCCAGCRESRFLPPDSTLPQTGTHLYFAECDPLGDHTGYRDPVTLVADPQYACFEDIRLSNGQSATWQSADFHAVPGTYREGYRLRLVRSLSDAASVATFNVVFTGVAASFVRQFDIEAGRNDVSVDFAEEGVITADTVCTVRILISAISGTASIRVAGNDDSHVRTELRRSNLCELRIDPGTSGGIGIPNTGLAFGARNAAGTISDSIFLDFTYGAVLNGLNLRFGPDYGPVCFWAAAGACRDTAVFWTIAPSQVYFEDVIGTYPNGSLISDGTNVWFWDLYRAQQDSVPCGLVRIRNASTNIYLIQHPVYDCNASFAAVYDQSATRIWIVGRYNAAIDTAWGYNRNGQLVSTVVGADIPEGRLYRGSWIQEVSHNAFERVVKIRLFDGSGSESYARIPTELTEEYAGGAGISRFAAALPDTHAVNVFDRYGQWIAYCPIAAPQNGNIQSVTVLSADSLVIYSARGIFPGTGTGQQVRVLRPR